MILSILFSLESKETSFDWVKNVWSMGSTLLLLNGVHLSAKTHWKRLLLSSCQSQTYYLSKYVELTGFFVVKKCLENWPIGLWFQQRII